MCVNRRLRRWGPQLRVHLWFPDECGAQRKGVQGFVAVGLMHAEMVILSTR